jgi:hypothetical protein
MTSMINFENVKINLNLPNELILIIFNFLTLDQCKKVGVTCKQLYLMYQYRFDIYLREQQNFDPNKYIFYDRWFKNQFKIKRIINKEDTTKKYHFIEFDYKNSNGKYIRRKLKKNYKKRYFTRNLIKANQFNKYIFKYKIDDINLIDRRYCDRCFGIDYCLKLSIGGKKCGVPGCDYIIKNGIGEKYHELYFSKKKKESNIYHHIHDLCIKCRKIVEEL